MTTTVEIWRKSLITSSEMTMSYLEDIAGIKFQTLDLNTPPPEPYDQTIEHTWAIDFQVKEFLYDVKKSEFLLSNFLTCSIIEGLKKTGWGPRSIVPIKCLELFYDDPMMLRQRRFGAYGWIDGYVNQEGLKRIT